MALRLTMGMNIISDMAILGNYFDMGIFFENMGVLWASALMAINMGIFLRP